MLCNTKQFDSFLKNKIACLKLVLFFLVLSFSIANAQVLKTSIDTSAVGPKMQKYYLSTDKKKDLNVIIDILSMSFEDRGTKDTFAISMGTFFSCVVAQDKQMKEVILNRLNNLQDPLKGYLDISIRVSPESFLNQMPTCAIKNDLYWSCFFVTGETKYLDLIMDNIKFIDQVDNLSLFSAAFTAQWSLSSNAEQDANVKNYLINIIASKDPVRSKVAAELLLFPASYFKQNAIKIMKQKKPVKN